MGLQKQGDLMGINRKIGRSLTLLVIRKAFSDETKNGSDEGPHSSRFWGSSIIYTRTNKKRKAYQQHGPFSGSV